MAEPKGSVQNQRMDTASGELPSGSSLTTKELQQNWRAVKRKEQHIKLLFDIPSARIIEQPLSKHVLYEIVLMLSGSFDSLRVTVERRYSDFCRLHHSLQEEFSEELEEVLLPRKLLTGNFRPENICERRMALRDYLAQLHSVRCVRHSPHFSDFFTAHERKQGHVLLRAGRFRAAQEQLRTVLAIQEKLLPWQTPTLLVPTLCALAVCHRDLDECEEAIAAAHRALPPVRRYGVQRYRAPLLELLVDVGYQLGRPVAQLQDELTALRDAQRGEVSYCSLKEVVIHEFL
ncbi:sorting nexin-20 [Cololabis saira]|uniref:sorting nexin-20 n=1 Tax=Cololabis saira TaxID=129043 RepID=UPI002AD4FD37|nr:sorting nexin-20 [Cololabis saira]